MMIIMSNVRGLRRLFPVASFLVFVFTRHSKISRKRRVCSVPPPRFITFIPFYFCLV